MHNADEILQPFWQAHVKKKILLTRPRASSERWAAILSQRGFDCVVEPMLTIEPTHALRPAGDFVAVLITSANAPDLMETIKDRIADLFALPCFCVGAATSAAARAAGFADVRCGVSDGAAIARLAVEAMAGKKGAILHIAGEDVTAATRRTVEEGGFALVHWAIYRAVAATDFTPATRELFRCGAFAAVTAYSPRSARTLVSIIEKNRLSQSCHAAVAVGLSQAVADVLQTLPWRRLCVAASPDEDEMFACLQSEFSMTESENKPAPSAVETSVPPQPSCGRKKRCWIGKLAGVLILAGLVYAGGIYCPWRPFVPAATDAGSVRALEKRVDALEAKLGEPIAAPQAPDAQDTAALNENVKNLEARLGQVEQQNGQNRQAAQKAMATMLTFWDLREAVRNGAAFAPQLAAFKTAVAGDATIAEQAARLEIYATQPVPTWNLLRASLIEREKEVAFAETSTERPSWLVRLTSALQALVSVRPAHDSRFENLERALESGDAASASTAYNALPPEAQEKLSAWHERMQARLTVDDALRALTAHLVAPAEQGSAP